MPGMTPPPAPPNLEPKATPSPSNPGFTMQQPSAGGFSPPPANGFAAPNAFSAAPPPVNQPQGVSMSQGADFNPESFNTGNSTDSGDPFADIDNVLAEEEEEKKPLNKKMLLIVGGAVLGILVVIIIIVVVIANGGNKATDETDGFTGNGVYRDEVTNGNSSIDSSTVEDQATLTPEELAALAALENGGQASSDPAFSGIPATPASSSEPVEDTSFHYSPEEADALRAVGYTGHEIEEFEKEEKKDIIELVKKQETAIRKKLTEEYQNMIRALQNASGDEAQEFLKTTWYGFPVQTLSEDVKDELGLGQVPTKVTRTENVDYEKIKLHGNQAWLRITLDNGDVVFMAINPVRYVSLEKDVGNIVITYTEETYLDGKFYEDIVEKKVN